MIAVSFPSHKYKIETTNGKEQIFDECRRRWVTLTPEEWVRQNFLQYLMLEKRYPASMIAVERELVLNNVKRRFDIVVFQHAVPWLLVECKEMNVPISEKTMWQVLNYNIGLQVKYLVLTNGFVTFGVHIQDGEAVSIHELPDYITG